MRNLAIVFLEYFGLKRVSLNISRKPALWHCPEKKRLFAPERRMISKAGCISTFQSVTIA